MRERAPTHRMEDRYEVAPQMRVYDALARVLVPHLTLVSRPNTENDTVNTDGYGFRRSYDGAGVVDTTSWWKRERRGIVLGGSYAFGLGATSDDNTFVSHLNRLTGDSFLNLGIVGAISLQELVAAVPFLAGADCIVVCSGINNLLAALQSLGDYDLFGPVFSEELFSALRSDSWEYVANLARSPLGALRSKKFRGAAVAEARRWIRRAFGGSGRSRQAAARPEPAEAMRQALRRQRRDLRVLMRSRRADSRLLFVVQPFVAASGKELAAEEIRLFEIMDRRQTPTWTVIKNTLVDLWPSYVDRLRESCEEDGVACVDLNPVDFRGWCYVDRVHMTDEGYLQAARRVAAELR